MNLPSKLLFGQLTMVNVVVILSRYTEKTIMVDGVIFDSNVLEN